MWEDKGIINAHLLETDTFILFQKDKIIWNFNDNEKTELIMNIKGGMGKPIAKEISKNFKINKIFQQQQQKSYKTCKKVEYESIGLIFEIQGNKLKSYFNIKDDIELPEWIFSITPKILNNELVWFNKKNEIILKESSPIIIKNGKYLNALWELSNNKQAKFIIDQEPPYLIDPIYSSFIGGNNYDSPSSVIFDNEDILMTINTMSNNFPVTNNSFNENYQGLWDCIVLRMDPLDIIWATYIGTNETDKCTSIGIENSNNETKIIIGGWTESYEFPGTTNESIYETCNNKNKSGFISGLSFDGSELIFSSLICGNGENLKINGISVEKNSIFLIGETTDILDSCSYKGGDSDGFLMEINLNGSNIIQTECIGGSRIDKGIDINVGNSLITVIGNTDSLNIGTPGVSGLTYEGGVSDCFIARYNLSFELEWLTYFGGSSLDECTGIAISPTTNTIWGSGITESVDIRVTWNTAYQTLVKESGKSGIFFELSSDGSEILYSSYITDEINDVSALGILLNELELPIVYGKGFISSNTNYDYGEATGFIGLFNKEKSELIQSIKSGLSVNKVLLDEFNNPWIFGETDNKLIVTEDRNQNYSGGLTDGFMIYEDRCRKGYFGNENWFINCSGCLKGFYNNEIGKEECLQCSLGKYSNKLGSTSCLKCSKGTYSNKLNSTICLDCPIGTYIDKEAATSCINCPKGTFSSTPSKCITCRVKERCLGKTKCIKGRNPETQCLTCLSSYYSFQTEYCSKCPESINYQLILFIFFIIVIGIIFIYLSSSLLKLSYFWVIIEGIQIVSVMALTLNFPELKAFGKILGVLVFDLNSLDYFNCSSLSFYNKFLIQLLLPFIFLIFFLFLFLISIGILKLLIKEDFNDILGILFDKLISSFGIFLKLSFIPLSLVTLKSLNFIKYDDGIIALEVDGFIKKNEIENFKIFLSILGILLYIFGIPLFFTIQIFRYRKGFFGDIFESRFNWIFQRFEEKLFYWEICDLIYQLLIIIICVFSKNDIAIITLIIIFLLKIVQILVFKPHFRETFYLSPPDSIHIGVVFILLGVMFLGTNKLLDKYYWILVICFSLLGVLSGVFGAFSGIRYSRRARKYEHDKLMRRLEKQKGSLSPIENDSGSIELDKVNISDTESSTEIGVERNINTVQNLVRIVDDSDGEIKPGKITFEEDEFQDTPPSTPIISKTSSRPQLSHQQSEVSDMLQRIQLRLSLQDLENNEIL